MFKSRTILRLVFAVSILGAAWGRTYLAAQQSNTRPGVNGAVVDLRNQLEKGLKARLPREFAFIDRIVQMVDNKQLPYDMVQSTFMWARVKKPYPFPYFESGLRTRAAKRGITI